MCHCFPRANKYSRSLLRASLPFIFPDGADSVDSCRSNNTRKLNDDSHLSANLQYILQGNYCIISHSAIRRHPHHPYPCALATLGCRAWYQVARASPATVALSILVPGFEIRIICRFKLACMQHGTPTEHVAPADRTTKPIRHDNHS